MYFTCDDTEVAMTDSKKAKAAKTQVEPENQISDVELDKVAGGRKAGETPKEFLVIKPPGK
jgi:hypothetical protein